MRTVVQSNGVRRAVVTLSVTEQMGAYIAQKATQTHCATVSEYVRGLIRADMARQTPTGDRQS